MSTNLLSCRTESYGKFAETAFEHLPSIDVYNIEIPTPAPGEIDQTIVKLERHGLTASTLQGSINIESDNAGRDFIPTLEAAGALGSKIVFVSVKAGDLGLQVVYDRLRSVGDEAGKRGITVGMETHPDLITNADVAIETMQGVNHPNIRVNYDTANIHYYNREVDSVEELRKVIDYVGSMHLKDTNGEFETWFFPTFGEGIVDFKAVFDLLATRGFYGPYTMEIEGIAGEDLNEEETCKRVADSVDYLRRIGCDV